MWHTFTNCLPQALVGFHGFWLAPRGLGIMYQYSLQQKSGLGPKRQRTTNPSTIPQRFLPEPFAAACANWLWKYDLVCARCKWMFCIWARNDLFVRSLVCPNSCLMQQLSPLCEKSSHRPALMNTQTHEYTNIHIYKNTSPAPCLPCHWLVIQAAGTLV